MPYFVFVLSFISSFNILSVPTIFRDIAIVAPLREMNYSSWVFVFNRVTDNYVRLNCILRS